MTLIAELRTKLSDRLRRRNHEVLKNYVDLVRQVVDGKKLPDADDVLDLLEKYGKTPDDLERDAEKLKTRRTQQAEVAGLAEAHKKCAAIEAELTATQAEFREVTTRLNKKIYELQSGLHSAMVLRDRLMEIDSRLRAEALRDQSGLHDVDLLTEERKLNERAAEIGRRLRTLEYDLNRAAEEFDDGNGRRRPTLLRRVVNAQSQLRDRDLSRDDRAKWEAHLARAQSEFDVAQKERQALEKEREKIQRRLKGILEAKVHA